MGKWENSDIEFELKIDSSNEVSITANTSGLIALRNGIDKLIQSKSAEEHFHIETENLPKNGMKYLVV